MTTALVMTLLVAFVAAPAVRADVDAWVAGESSCSTTAQIAPVITSPGTLDLPVPVLLSTNQPVRGVQFGLDLPEDLTLLDCNAVLPGYNCTMRTTETGAFFVLVAFSGAPIPAGSNQPVLELIFDVIPLVLDRQIALPLRDLEVLGDGCEVCAAEDLMGGIQVSAGCEFFLEDMESGAPGWSHQVRKETAKNIEKIADPIGLDSWHLADQTCVNVALPSTMYMSNGNRGRSCVGDSSRDLSQLLSPQIGLPHSDALFLEFDALSFDEAGECLASGQFDRHDVGVTTDGGLTYELLNNCTALADGTGSPIRHVFDVTAYAGTSVQIIFVYDTGDANNGHTFAVDNVAVIARDMICGSCEGLMLLEEPPQESPVVYESCGSVFAGDAFHVGTDKDVTIRSGTRIVLSDGFHVEPGGRFGAVIDPGIVDVSKAPRRFDAPAPSQAPASQSKESSR